MIADIYSVNNDWSFCDVVKPQKQTCDSRFTRATVTDYSNTLVRLDSQVEFAKNVSAATGVSEENISKLDASVKIHNISWLLRVNCRLLFNDTKYSTGSLLCFRNTGHLTDTYSTADSTHKNDVTACKDTLRVETEPLYEYGSNVKNESDEDESNWLWVTKEEAANMCSLNVSEMRHHQQFRVPMQNKLKVLFAEGDHRSVVHNDVV